VLKNRSKDCVFVVARFLSRLTELKVGDEVEETISSVDVTASGVVVAVR